MARKSKPRRARRAPRALARYGDESALANPGGFMLPLWGWAAGGLLAALMFSKKGAIVSGAATVVGMAKEKAFALALPSQVGQYAKNILIAAERYGVDPWALAAIMWNESRGGTAAPHYRPTGPGGTGDWTGRFDPRTGKHTSTGWQHANPATGLPPDGLGWGRGLMQVDYGVNIEWIKAGGAWWDAQTNINKGAELLAEKYRYFKIVPKPGTMVAVESWRITTGKPKYDIQPWAVKYPRAGSWPTSVPDPRPLSGQKLVEASVAAYNVSYTAVLQALGLGLPAEAGTSTQNYVTKFMALVAGWRAKFTG